MRCQHIPFLKDDSHQEVPLISGLLGMIFGLAACPALVDLNSTLVSLIRVPISSNNAQLSLIAFSFH